MVTIGSKLFIWGGCAADCVDVAVYCLDMGTMSWERRHASTGAPPAARAGHTMAVVHERLVIIGGCDGKRGTCYPGVHVYDPARDMWTSPTLLGAAQPIGLQGALAAVVGGEITLYGGCRVKGAAALPRRGSDVLCSAEAWSRSLPTSATTRPAYLASISCRSTSSVALENDPGGTRTVS